MSKRTLGALLTLNLILVAALLALLWPLPSVTAQPIPPGRYSLVAGTTRQRPNVDLIYVVDWNANRAAAFYFDANANRVTTVGDVNLRNVSRDTGRGR